VLSLLFESFHPFLKVCLFKQADAYVSYNSRIKTREAHRGLHFRKGALDMAEVAGSNPAEPIGFWGCFDEIASGSPCLSI
jgi:hypothetical protein